MTKTKTIQKLPELEQQQIEEINLDEKLYPITEHVDEFGKVVVSLRCEYETGNCDNETGFFAIEFEGYRNFKRRTRLVSWNELVEADRREREILDLNRRIFPSQTEPHNHLLTQNPEVQSSPDRRTGFTEDGCGEKL